MHSQSSLANHFNVSLEAAQRANLAFLRGIYNSSLRYHERDRGR